MLYSRFLASLLAKHKRDGAARGRMHQQDPPPQQPQTGSVAPVYQQQGQTTQQAPPSHGTTAFATGGNPTTVQDVPHSVPMNVPPTAAQTVFKDTANINEPIHQVDAPSYTFGSTTTAPPADSMDFVFDSISLDELLGPMKAIENPQWMQTMMLPGCVLLFIVVILVSNHLCASCSFSWPSDESYAFFGNNNLTADGYQNFMTPQPTAVGLN